LLPILLYKWGPRSTKNTTSSTLLTAKDQDWYY
jgi:hypothetical protein